MFTYMHAYLLLNYSSRLISVNNLCLQLTSFLTRVQHPFLWPPPSYGAVLVVLLLLLYLHTFVYVYAYMHNTYICDEIVYSGF